MTNVMLVDWKLIMIEIFQNTGLATSITNNVTYLRK